ncbi:MAG: hypothetical protein ACLFSN_02510 [Candidatus Woesearchaeota archaeon]
MNSNLVFIGLLAMLVLIAGCAQQSDKTPDAVLDGKNASFIEERFPSQPDDAADKGEQLPDQQFPYEGFCENKCGDGQCDELVCMADGCPCTETPENCPRDCA